jgi:hypothetical protein
MVLGVIGGLGAGLTFAFATPLWLDFFGFVLVQRTTGAILLMDFSAVLLIAAASMTAMFAGRFGWVATGAGAVVAYVLGEIDHGGLATFVSTGTSEESVTALFWGLSVADGIVLGGALAAFGAADRNGRRAIAPGLAAGAVGGVYLFFTVGLAGSQGHLDRELVRIVGYLPLALCVAAAIGSLVLLIRRRDGNAATSVPDWVLPTTSAVAASAAIAWVVLAALDPSQGLYVAAAAAVVIAAVAAWRAGPVAAAWAIVGFAAGSATGIDELIRLGDGEVGHFAAVAVGGVVLGVLLTGFITKMPWESIALLGVAAAVLASRPPSPLDLLDSQTHYPAGPVTAVGLIGLATGAMLLRLGDCVRELRTAAAAGFATFVVGGVLAGQISGYRIFENPVWDRRGIAIGVGGLVVLALHLVNMKRHAATAGA